MMGHRIDRIWLLGGVVVTVLLAAISWFFVIHPRRVDTDAVRQQTADETIQLTKLRHQLADLDAKKKQLTALRAKLAAYQLALPPENTTPAKNSQAAFLNQLQAYGVAENVDISSLTVGTPVKSESVPAAKTVPITLVLGGNIDDISQFLLRMQNLQGRAVLVTSISQTADQDPDGNVLNTVSVNLALTAFVTTNTGSTSLTTK
jgi:Tfp pilus assembly protein PilO